MDRLPPETAFTADDWLAQFQRLMPEGEVWPRDPDAKQTQALRTLMGTYRRLTYRDGYLLVDAFPPYTNELLTEWEQTLGLPDPCTPLNPTVIQRVAAVAAKVIAQGGQSIPYFISVAAALGFTITVSEFAPFRAGISTAGSPDYGQDWAHTWLVNVPDTDTFSYFRADDSAAGDALVSWGNAEMECRLRAIAPAHTILIFGYPGGTLDGFVLDTDTLS